MIYASSYIRGLIILLRGWKKIRDHHPEATLDICYGRNTWGCGEVDDEMKKLLEQPGITEHGMISHADLAKKFKSCSIWAYPCTYDETFCITAIKAQAAGCRPVVIKRAALYETICPHVESSFCDDYCDNLIRNLSDEITEDERERYREFAKNFQWSDVCSKWLSLVA